ncbi:MAG: YcbK family protein [Desulfobacterales bacterium]|nr:MAG: YcbK family protein [Desulfobacterales bacterium]
MTWAKALNRRDFLTVGGAAAAMVLNPLPAWAAFRDLLKPVRKLTFYNTHTDERLSVRYYINGKYDRKALSDINYILRDHRTDDIFDIDRSLLDLLYAISVKTRSHAATFEVISGYRSPATNALLHKKSRGVATKSLHMLGKAIDIRLSGHDTRRLHKTAVKLKGGGVGFYPKSDFVHVDVGSVRYW